MEQLKTGSRIDFYPVPRFRRRSATAKIHTVKGSRVEILGALCPKYYSPLDSMDRRNGRIAAILRLPLLLPSAKKLSHLLPLKIYISTTISLMEHPNVRHLDRNISNDFIQLLVEILSKK